MNGDSLELMKELGRIHADLKQDIGNVKAEIAGFKGQADARIAAVEKDMTDRNFWDNVKLYSGPALVALHITAHKLGLKV